MKEEDMALDLWIDEQLEKGYIEPLISLYASSFFFIKKKDGKLCPVQDYRTINSYTVRNQYPLPLILSKKGSRPKVRQKSILSHNPLHLVIY